jgi:hypothetical protein
MKGAEVRVEENELLLPGFPGLMSRKSMPRSAFRHRSSSKRFVSKDIADSEQAEF